MEIVAPGPPVLAAPRPVAAYPTISESWGIVGWYLLVMVGVGVPVMLISEKGFHLSRSVSSSVLTVLSSVALLGFLRWKAGSRWQPLRFGGQARWWQFAALLVAVPALVVVLSVLDYLHLPNWMSETFQKMMRQPVAAFLGIVVAAPVLEEVLFRGVILRGLLRNQRPWVAIGQSALIFGLIHFNPAQSLSAALMGAVVGWLYYRTQSLWLCMGVHALNNLLGFLGMLLAPPAWEALSPAAMLGSAWLYAGALVLSALVLTVFMRLVWQTTTPQVAASTEGAE